MNRIDNNFSTQETSATENANDNKKIDTEGNFNGKKTTAKSSNKKINSSRLNKFLPKGLFTRKAKKNTTNKLQNISQAKTSKQQKKNLATMNNIDQAIKKYQEFHEDNTSKTVSDTTLELLQDARNKCNTADSIEAKKTIKDLLTSISTDLQHNNTSTKDLKNLKNEFAKEEKTQQKRINTLYKQAPSVGSHKKLNDNVSYKDYLESQKNLLTELINFRNETFNELSAEIKQLDKEINALAPLHDTKSKQNLNDKINHKNNLIEKIKRY